MSKRIGSYPCVRVEGGGRGVVSQAGAVLLVETVRKVGLDAALSGGLAPWRRPRAIHDPGKVVLDVALAVALGGDCLADVGMLRAEPGLFGPVACDPTVSRLIDTLAAAGPTALAAIRAARSQVRARVWELAADAAPDAGGQVTVDLDGLLVVAHSDKEGAAATFKRGWGHHPLWSFADHGPDGTGEPLSVMLRPGNAGSNTAADHIVVIREALRQLPFPTSGRVGHKVLVRIDGAGASHEVVDYLVARGLSYSVGFTLPDNTADLLQLIPEAAWTPAYDADGQVRDGAWVAELTGLLNLQANSWPAGMRVIARRERPHPGAQLRITDIDGNRITAFATNTPTAGPGTALPDLELRHRRRARCEDRIRCAKDTGLANLPLHDLDQNRIWCAIVALACEITAWTQTLALTGHQARRWEPKRLRLRLFSIAGALATTARVRTLHLSGHSPWADLALQALHRLRSLAGLPAPAG